MAINTIRSHQSVLIHHRSFRQYQHHSVYSKIRWPKPVRIPWLYCQTPDIGWMELITNVHSIRAAMLSYHMAHGVLNLKPTIRPNAIDDFSLPANIRIWLDTMMCWDRFCCRSRTRTLPIKSTFEFCWDLKRERCTRSFHCHVWHRIHRRWKWPGYSTIK